MRLTDGKIYYTEKEFDVILSIHLKDVNYKFNPLNNCILCMNKEDMLMTDKILSDNGFKTNWKLDREKEIYYSEIIKTFLHNS